MGADLIDVHAERAGLPVIIGVIAAADTPGTAVDICAFNNFAVVADSEAGVCVFDVRNGEARVARWYEPPTPAMRNEADAADLAQELRESRQWLELLRQGTLSLLLQERATQVAVHLRTAVE